MGKTYRRKDVEPKGRYWNNRRTAPDGISDSMVADNIFHSDKPKRWSGLDSSVKEDQNRYARADKRRLKHLAVYSETEELLNDKTYARKANECWKHS